MKKLIVTAGAILLLLPVLFAQSSWSHMGPFKDNSPGNLFETGRLDVVRLHPQFDGTTNKTIYAGSAGGGLWKTTDNGVNWGNINTVNLHFSGISAMAIEPGANGPVYVADESWVGPNATAGGTGGIYKYFPSSSTWANTGSFPGAVQPFYVNNIQIHPSNSAYVFACTSAGLYRSVNSGTTWTLVQPGAIENVTFVPRTGGSGTYPYYIYAGGRMAFVESADDGASFTSIASMNTLFAQYDDVYVDIAYTASSTPGIYYVYAYGVVYRAGTPIVVSRDYYNNPATVTKATDLFKYTYDANTSTSGSAEVVRFRTHDDSEDRLAIVASDLLVWMGSTAVYKWNGITGSLYIAENGVDSNQPGPGLGYSSWTVHPDMHDFVMFPALNRIYIMCDGGAYINTYTTAANGVWTNSVQMINNGLHISQVWGFSGAETEPEFFATGEADTKGFMNMTLGNSLGLPTTFRNFGGNEPPAVHIDFFNSNNMFFRSSAYGMAMSYTTNKNVSLASYQNSALAPDPVDFCTTVSSWPSGTIFATNTFYQDPNRPDKIFYGLNDNLSEFCPGSKKFLMKYRPSIYHNSTYYPGEPLKWMSWYNVPTGMGFSRANKNRVYFCTNNRVVPSTGEYFAGQVFMYTGPDIDDSWVGHNENQWQRITPDFTVPGLVSVPLTVSEAYEVWYTGMVASDWDPDRAWVTIYDVPNNPAVKVLKYQSGTWTDYSTGIPVDEAVLSFVYEQGTNDQLYLSTNRGVYYRDATMSMWMPFMNNLPHIRVSQLQVNYHENTVRAGTLGRGVWKSQLNCPGLYNVTKTGTTSVSEFTEATNNITAQNLTITNGSVVYRGGASIDILPNFLVTANGSTNFLAFIHGCNVAGTSYFREEGEEETTQETEDIELPEELRQDFVAFPSPNDGVFFIQKRKDEESGEEGKTEEADIFIYDTMGKLIMSLTDVTDNTVRVDMTGAPKGIYLVRCIMNGHVSTQKIICK
ncbi:MAG: PDK repeat-containing protein [Bacteroidetes bacterium]|nr:MAG: PDK repeat-containing protein [Bacteroidota bacterium]